MKPIEYKPNQVRVFLGLLLIVAALFTWRWTAGSALRLPLLAAEAVATAAFVIWPKAFFPIFRVIMIGSGHLGHAIFTVISAVFFFLILTPMALIMRAGGKVFMPSRTDRHLDTYFEPGQDNLGHERQF